MKTLDDLFNDREAELRAEHEEREAAEALRRDSLTPEERAQEDEARIARLEALWEAPDDPPDEDEEEECDLCGNDYDPIFGCQHCDMMRGMDED